MERRIFQGALAVLIALVLTIRTDAQPDKDKGPDDAPKKGKKESPSVSLNTTKAFKGYTMVAPMNSTKAHLIDLEGCVVHTWDCGATPAVSTYLLENGHLLRPSTLGKGGVAAPGAGGRVMEFDWDGTVLWDYRYEGKNQFPHHDITRLPNGNILMIVADRKTKEEAIAAGRRPETTSGGLTADAIIEIKPTGKNTAEIVWEWHSWDHLVQDHDKTKDNYGKVSGSPERIDINYGLGMFGGGWFGGFKKDKDGPKDKDGKDTKDKDTKDKDGKDSKDKDTKDTKDKDGKDTKKTDLEKLKDLGYLGGPKATGKFNFSSDWTHANAVAYNADLDQIMISVHSFSEFWIIDHSTSTKEAAGKTGGKYGKGGDLLYRWGNPQAYRMGSNADRRLFMQHDTHWIPKGLPGAGNIIMFNNGQGRPDGKYSSVDEIVLPVNKDGTYHRKPGQPFGPAKATWSYTTKKKTDFFAFFVSGANRLPNGNTLICNGPAGAVFEVTPEKEVVWEFTYPKKGGGFGFFPGGKGGFGSPPGMFRSYRYAEDYPAFKDRKLVPGKKIEEL
jgi:hypothetical protein